MNIHLVRQSFDQKIPTTIGGLLQQGEYFFGVCIA
jgi:hypothetical protein